MQLSNITGHPFSGVGSFYPIDTASTEKSKSIQIYNNRNECKEVNWEALFYIFILRIVIHINTILFTSSNGNCLVLVLYPDYLLPAQVNQTSGVLLPSFAVPSVSKTGVDLSLIVSKSRLKDWPTDGWLIYKHMR